MPATTSLASLSGVVSQASLQPCGTATTDILLPSTLIRLLHSTYPAHFKRLLGADQGLWNRFWGQLLERPQNRGWMQ